MSSENQTAGNLPVNCPHCNEHVIKTASDTFVCTNCGHSSKARPIR